MIKREAKSQVILNKYFREKKLFCNYELKHTSSNRLRFSAVPDHQIEGLVAAEESGYVWKHSDLDQRVKPFDGSSIPPLPGYIIVRYTEAYVFIRVMEFIKEKSTHPHGLGTLSYEEACEIAERMLVV